MTVLQPWRRLRSEILVADQWIRLRADACATAEGTEISPYYVLEYPDWVHVVPVSATGRLLLIEQYRHAVGRVCLELPAGRIDVSDPDPIAAGQRELLEETGCSGERPELLAPATVNPASHTNLVQTILLHEVRQVSTPQDDPTERIRTHWVSGAEALRLAASGALPGLQTASLFAAALRLGWLEFRAPA